MSTILVELDRPDCLLVDPELFSQLIGVIGVLENVDLACKTNLISVLQFYTKATKQLFITINECGGNEVLFRVERQICQVSL